MNYIQFHNLFEDILIEIRNRADSKAAEYAADTDRLENLKAIAEIDNTSPHQAAFTLMLKHFVSVRSYIKSKKKYTPDNLNKKIIDLIVYLILIYASLLNGVKHEPKSRI